MPFGENRTRNFGALGKEQILRAISSSTRSVNGSNGGVESISGVEAHARYFQRSPFEFAPLVCEDFGTVCHLDILFFRREDTRALITKPKDEYGGDLDNRLKMFFNALKVPDAVQLKGLELPTEEIVYCLVPDDSLITKFQLDSAYLLEPPASASRDDLTQVKLLVRVNTRQVRHGASNTGYDRRFFA